MVCVGVAPAWQGRAGGEVGAPLASARMHIRYDSGATTEVAVDRVRLKDFAGSVPWRRWRSRRGQAHLSGMYWAATTGGHVVYESRLELARLLLADFDPQVAWMWAQPGRLDAVVEGRGRRHVPDFLFESPSGVATVVNVKPARRLSDPKVAAALAWPREVLSGHGWRYEVWSGCDPVVLENVRFLAAYRRPGILAEATLTAALEVVGEGGLLGEVEARLAAGAPGWTVRPGLLALVWRHRLVIDLTMPLSTRSVLRRVDATPQQAPGGVNG
jgi:hypothetical protein